MLSKIKSIALNGLDGNLVEIQTDISNGIPEFEIVGLPDTTVKEAKKYAYEKQKDLVIFAGACQSYFEALISAGANFASSPARILIEFLDPLIVAKSVATTDTYKYITIDDIAGELRDGKKGVGGLGAYGKKSIIFI